MALAANRASAVSVYDLPFVKLTITGTITYSSNAFATNVIGGVSKGEAAKTVAYNTQSLIQLLNASRTFTNALTNALGDPSKNQIPAGSYFLWDFGGGYNGYAGLIITNANGFSVNIYNMPSGGSSYTFGEMEYDGDYLYGSFSRNDLTGKGSETDQTGIYFYFYDYNGNEIECYASGTLKWKFGAASAGTQTATLSLTADSGAAGGYLGQVNYSNDGAATFKASGMWTSTDPVNQFPFYIWDY